jgi:hypothetical protein
VQLRSHKSATFYFLLFSLRSDADVLEHQFTFWLSPLCGLCGVLTLFVGRLYISVLQRPSVLSPARLMLRYTAVLHRSVTSTPHPIWIFPTTLQKLKVSTPIPRTRHRQSIESATPIAGRTSSAWAPADDIAPSSLPPITLACPSSRAYRRSRLCTSAKRV